MVTADVAIYFEHGLLNLCCLHFADTVPVYGHVAAILGFKFSRNPGRQLIYPFVSTLVSTCKFDK